MELDRIDRLFRAFADPTRLRILSLLRGGETCVGDLVEALELQQPTVSRHLAYLRDAHLVSCRRDGPWRLYALGRPQSAFHRRLLECLGSCFSEVPQLAIDAERARKIRELGSCGPERTDAG